MFYLNALGIVCPLGDTHHAITHALFTAQSGLRATDQYTANGSLPLGRVTTSLPAIDHLPLTMRSRNNQLALAALLQIRDQIDAAIDQFGKERVGVVLGTSTSGIAESEQAIREYIRSGTLPNHFHLAQQELGSPAQLLVRELGITGPAYVHSSACSSSSKAMASAARLINMGLCDAVITGGVDSLCAFTIAGFAALESVSSTPCNPLSKNRNGINIGEGCALFLMTKNPATVALKGWGESSDGHHMSAPDPNGVGAQIAIERALKSAGITAKQIEYVNLHGTATKQNDAMESKVIHALMSDGVPVSSTKPFTGHALGAAGAIEAAICWLTMQDANADGKLPPHLWDGVIDSELPLLNTVTLADKLLGRPPKRVLSNSFAFGGSNAVLVLERE